jgi:hypothetical protein
VLGKMLAFVHLCVLYHISSRSVLKSLWSNHFPLPVAVMHFFSLFHTISFIVFVCLLYERVLCSFLEKQTEFCLLIGSEDI